MKRNKMLALVLMCAGLMFLMACSTKEVTETKNTVLQEEAVEKEEADLQEETVETEEANLQEADSRLQEEELSEVSTETGETAEIMETGQIISISMEEMKEKLAAGEDFLISFVTINCPYCQEFHSMLVDYIQEHIVTMYQVILDYEELPEEENRKIIKELFTEFNTVPGTFYVENGENASYLDMYNLGVGMEVFDAWIQELGIEE